MRKQRDLALQEFQLAEEMPFCAEEGELEEITAALSNIVVRRVDQNLLQKKKRRVGSTKVVEIKPIDESITKALMRLCNVVQDCIAVEHKISQNQKQIATMKVNRVARESKAKQIKRGRVLDEIQTRTRLRQDRIARDVQQKMQAAAATSIANREPGRKPDTRRQERETLRATENLYNDLYQLEKETDNQKRIRKSTARHEKAKSQLRREREIVDESIRTLRSGMDKLDSAADAALNRRFAIRT